MIRAFLAFDIPAKVKKNLGTLIETLRPQSAGVKWVEPQNFHVTLKFFGNIDEGKMLSGIEAKIQQEVAAQKTSRFLCEGIGAFPSFRNPRVIWAGLTGDVAGMIDLTKRLGRLQRDFTPHLTLARIKGSIRDKAWLVALEKMPPKVYGEVVVDHLTLYKSTLTKQGPIYTALNEFPFKQ